MEPSDKIGIGVSLEIRRIERFSAQGGALPGP